jgi:hypothetical protein
MDYDIIKNTDKKMTQQWVLKATINSTETQAQINSKSSRKAKW